MYSMEGRNGKERARSIAPTDHNCQCQWSVSLAASTISWYSHHSIYYEHIHKFHQQLPQSPFPPQQECSRPSCQQVHLACNLFPFQCCTEHITTHQSSCKPKNSLIPWLLPSFVLAIPEQCEKLENLMWLWQPCTLSSSLPVTTLHSPFLYSRSMWQKDAEDTGNKATQRGYLRHTHADAACLFVGHQPPDLLLSFHVLQDNCTALGDQNRWKWRKPGVRFSCCKQQGRPGNEANTYHLLPMSCAERTRSKTNLKHLTLHET